MTRGRHHAVIARDTLQSRTAARYGNSVTPPARDPIATNGGAAAVETTAPPQPSPGRSCPQTAARTSGISHTAVAMTGRET